LLTLLPTPIGNIEDISLRALRVLEEADAILCEDTRVAKKLLTLLSERHGLNHHIHTFISLHSHNESEVLQKLTPDFFDQHVVYMSDAGMPCISDPGARLVAYCQKHGIDYTVLPGPSAFTTAFAASGFIETHFSFYGFLPHKGRERKEALREVLSQPWSTILYEAPHRLEKLLDELIAEAEDRTIFMAKEITKKHERFFKGQPAELKQAITGSLLKGEWVIIISPTTERKETTTLSLQEIEILDLPPKQKAKLISKLTGQSVKVCYNQLMQKEKS